MKKQTTELKKEVSMAVLNTCETKDKSQKENLLFTKACTDNPANNSKTTNINKPTIFNKKSKIVVTKPLTYINSDTGKTRHFTPAAQE
jgi:hypothetical protein